MDTADKDLTVAATVDGDLNRASSAATSQVPRSLRRTRLARSTTWALGLAP